MQRAPQAQEDLLDVIFQNRNKSYGAYTLRKGYDQTMTRSFLYCLALLASMVIWINLRPTKDNSPKPVYKGREIILDTEPVYLASNAPKPEQQPEAQSGSQQAGPGNIIQITRHPTTFTGTDTSNQGGGGEDGGNPSQGGGGGGTGGGNDSVPSTTTNPYQPLDYSDEQPEFPGELQP